MREIKFRAWDNKEGFKYFQIPYMSDQMHNWLQKPESDNRIFEQYTGLKDKNGKEIYEGDILRCIDFSDDYFPDWTDVVEYDSRGCWTVDGGNVLGNMYNNDMMEIIGNIHENPELLK